MSYNLVVNSKFNPFSYQELALPLMQATQAHKELELAYSTLADEAEKLEVLKNSSQDADVYAQYKAYDDALKAASDDLATNGLTFTSRKNLQNLKREYNKTIIPIQTAFARRLEIAKEQQALRAKDGTMMFDTEAKDIALRALIDNPNFQYGTQSGEALTKMSAQMASALQKELMSGANKAKWVSILGNQYYQRALQYGITSDELMAFINKESKKGNPAANEKLQAISDAVRQASNIRNWNNADTFSDRETSFINQGLYHAIGTTQYDKLDNWLYKMQVQDAMARRRAEEQRQAAAAAAAQQDTIQVLPNIRIEPYYAKNSEFKSSLKASLDSEIKEGRIRMNPETGKYEATDKGKEYYRTGKEKITDMVSGPSMQGGARIINRTIDKSAFINSLLNLDKSVGRGKNMDENIEKALQILNSNRPEFNDTVSTPVMRYPISSENSTNIARMIQSQIANMDIYESELTDKGVQKTSNRLRDISTVESVNNIYISKGGVLLNISYKDDEGKVHTTNIKSPIYGGDELSNRFDYVVQSENAAKDIIQLAQTVNDPAAVNQVLQGKLQDIISKYPKTIPIINKALQITGNQVDAATMVQALQETSNSVKIKTYKEVANVFGVNNNQTQTNAQGQ